jgi:hypothetical protein
MLAPSTLYGQDLLKYREFLLGSNLAAVTKTGAGSLENVKVLHQRPALIQELRWRPQSYTTTAGPSDPVREVTFSFYDDQLFRIVVEYDRQRIEGLTDADLVESITAIYGTALLTATALPTGPAESAPDRDQVVACWADAESSLTLLRSTYPTSLRLVISLTRLQDLAAVAASEAIRLDRQEAPQREIDRNQKAAEDGRIAAEQARGANKPAFKP